MKFKLTYRLRGSSMTEVLAAFAIIAIAFVMGGNIWAGLQRNHNPVYNWKVNQALRELVYTEVDPGFLGTETIELIGFECKRTVSKFPGKGNRFLIEAECFREGTMLGTRNRILSTD